MPVCFLFDIFHLSSFFLSVAKFFVGAIFRWERDEEAAVDEEGDNNNKEASDLTLPKGEAKETSPFSSSDSPQKTEDEKQEDRRGKEEQGEHAHTVVSSSFSSREIRNDGRPTPSSDSSECLHGATAEELSRKTREGGKSFAEDEEEQCVLQGDMRRPRSCCTEKESEESFSRVGVTEECTGDDAMIEERRDREERGREAEGKKDEEKNRKKEDEKIMMEEETNRNSNNSKEDEETKVNRTEEEFSSAEGGVSLELPVSFNLYDCYKHTPLSFSNYVNGFQATLDYIFASQDLQVSIIDLHADALSQAEEQKERKSKERKEHSVRRLLCFFRRITTRRRWQSLE